MWIEWILWTKLNEFYQRLKYYLMHEKYFNRVILSRRFSTSLGEMSTSLWIFALTIRYFNLTNDKNNYYLKMIEKKTFLLHFKINMNVNNQPILRNEKYISTFDSIPEQEAFFFTHQHLNLLLLKSSENCQLQFFHERMQLFNIFSRL